MLEVADFGNWSENLRDNEGNKVPKPSPPKELLLAWQCREWKSLPRTGGILDQPVGLMEMLSYVLRIHDAHKAWRNKTPGKEDELPEGTYEIIKLIENMRKDNGTE